MGPIIRFYAYNLGYWLFLSVVARLIFILFYLSGYPGNRTTGLINSFVYGSRLDLSMSSYIIALSLLVWLLYSLFKIEFGFTSYRILGILILGLILLITIADVVVYQHWAIKINITAIQFAQHPREVIASMGKEDHILLMVMIYIVLMAGFIWLWVRMTDRLKYRLNIRGHSLFFNLVAFLLISAATVLGIRGGVQLEPINQSAVYFSDQAIYNHTAVNASWNLMNKWVNNRDGKNPYSYGTPAEVEESLRRFYTSSGQTNSFIDSSAQPNIVFIILEGFTADVIRAFGGESGLTPTIDSLIREGLIFTRFYSNGDRTYKGLPSILNGYPTQPTSSVTQNADLTGKIPSLAKTLSQFKYTSSFYYGGESEFANIKSYLLNTGFNKIVDIRDFPASYRGIKWGVSDHYVFERMSADLNQTPQPFFSCILTLSSHEPYDIPMKPLLNGKSSPDLFRNTVYYTDWSLAQFIHLSEKQPWYPNTLFVLTADHGNPMPKEYKNNYDPGRFKVPLLIFGNPLKPQYRGQQINIVGSHTDLATTLLHCLGLNHDSFAYSKNLIAVTPSTGAYYTFDNGFGLINDSSKLVFDHVGSRVVIQQGPVNDSLILLGKRLLQGTFKPK